MKTIKPLNGEILVSPRETNQTVGGIYLANPLTASVISGTAVACSPGKQEGEHFNENPVKEGDTVWYLSSASVDVDFEGTKYHFVNMTNILGVEVK